ncbi:MAG: FAD-binding oxidoreductase [Thermoguttaceae bacterium]
MNDIQTRLPLRELLHPADEAGVAAAVRTAYEKALPVYPIGGGTQLDWGARPTEPGVGLALAGLNQIVDYPARDLTITVQAGLTLAALAKRLGAQGQRLPVEVPQPEQATLGGIVATCPPGPRQYRWGSIRDYVIGLRAVDGTGQVFSAGGRVVKNAAGYDLGRLLTGSLGTLGVITQVTLMLRPLPETSALASCNVPDFDTAERLLAGLVHTRTLPSAIELLAGPAWREDPLLGPAADPPGLRLVVGLEGTLAEVEWMIGQLHKEWHQAGAACAVTLRGLRADPLWQRLTEFPAQNASGSVPGTIAVQIHVLPGCVVAAIGRVLEIDPAATIAAHAGAGIIRAVLNLGPKDLASVLDGRLRPMLSAIGGLVVVRREPPGMTLGWQTVWGPPRTVQVLMQAIKDRFDPKGILNRGRFVFAPPGR